MPERLSQLGCFEGDDPRSPALELVEYTVNAPLWLDGAEKERWLALPDGARIELDEHGDFMLPVGTVLGKIMSLGETRVETRIFMNDRDEGWQGYAYRWNQEGTDAVLEPEAGEALHGVGPNAQDWTIPGRGQCGQCHNTQTHVSLGLEVAQLNREFTDPRTGETFDQLDRLIARGVLDGNHPTLAERAARPKLADYHDATLPIPARARAYLAGNCASCHTAPENICSGDLRWFASDAQMGVCGKDPKLPSLDWPDGTMLLAPGKPDRSAIVHRLSALGGSPLAMPPIGRHGVDAQGVALVTQWIREMQSCQP